MVRIICIVEASMLNLVVLKMMDFQEDTPKPGQPGQPPRPAGGAPAAPRA